MINLHKDNSSRARYEASYLSWLHFIFINMLTGWIPKKDDRENIKEGFVSLSALVGIGIIILLTPVSLPILSLLAMISERRKFVRHWGKTASKSEEK